MYNGGITERSSTMNTIICNGIEYKVETDHTNVALCDMQTNEVLIEATFDHNTEQLFVNVIEEDEQETLSYFEFVNNTEALADWMANRLFV
jgi:hypothetical protein